MVWFQVCDTFWSHHKVIDLPPSAGWLWVRAGSYCAQHLTDGFITAGVVKMLGGTDDDATTLVFAGLWKSVRGGYRFHDWDGYQQSREEVLSKRAALAERQRKYRASRSKSTDESSGVSNALHDALVFDPNPIQTKPNKEHMLTAVAESAHVQSAQSEHAQSAHTFEHFWNVYPRKVGKSRAHKVFTKESKSTDPAEIIAGAQRLADDPNLPDKTFIPHPATWLSRAGWLDEPYPQRETKPADKPTPQPPKFDRAAAINPEAVPPPANLHDILKGNTS